MAVAYRRTHTRWWDELTYNPSDKTQMFFRGGRERIDPFPGTTSYSAYPQYDLGYLNREPELSAIQLTHTFNSYLLNNTKLSFTRFNTITSFNTA